MSRRNSWTRCSRHFDRAAVKAAKVIAKGLPGCQRCDRPHLFQRRLRVVQVAHEFQKAARARRDFPEDLRGMIAAEGILTDARRRQFARGAGGAAEMGKCAFAAAALVVD